MVDIPGNTVTEPDTELGKKIMKMMCVEAAEGIKVQCGREYGFADPGPHPRATHFIFIVTKSA